MRKLRDAYDPRAVVRPTMVPDREEAIATGGHFAKMLDSGFNDPPPPALDPLEVQEPTVTGDAIVGYTLTCSEPSITGGSGDVQITYYWQDASNKRVLYMGGSTQVVQVADIGRTLCCQVVVIDQETNEQVIVVSNAVGPVNRPTLPDYSVLIDDQPYDGVSVGVQPNGILTIAAVADDPVLFPPKDVTFGWEIRQGGGRFNGDPNLPFIAYIAPDTAPAAALVTCDILSRDADDAQALSVEILVSGP